MSDLKGYTVGATDGDIGSLVDVYFDDESWTVRYFVVDTGRWLPGRTVLISPASLDGVDPPGRRLPSRLTRAQVKDSPSVDTSRPVSRQHEMATALHYGYPQYWTGPYRWGPVPYPGATPPIGAPLAATPSEPATSERVSRAREGGDPHLRSAGTIRGYGIEATDGTLGHVEDFLVDEESWAIRYLVVDPRSWWPGPHVVIAVEWIEDIRWSDEKVVVDVTRETVRTAPQYDASGTLPREYEARLHGHYHRRGYWERPPAAWMLWPPAA